MSDPIFLRNVMSSSVYAEQINSAQIQGQVAARERATRARQEAMKNEQAAVKSLEDMENIDIRERERSQQQYPNGEPREDEETATEDRHGEHESQEGVRAFRHIDLTV